MGVSSPLIFFLLLWMKRTVRPSPYQVADLRNVASVPRPLYRKVVFINPFQASRQGLEVVAPGSSAAAPGSATSVVGQYWAGKGELDRNKQIVA